MAHSSWKVFSSFTTSRTDDHDEVLFMLDEIPTDNESTTEEEPDSEPDNTALETDSEESEDSSPQPSDGEPHETTSEGPSTSKQEVQCNNFRNLLSSVFEIVACL